MSIETPYSRRQFLRSAGGGLGGLALTAMLSGEIGAELTVVPMRGWDRSMLFPDTGLTWVPPSPNMPRWETALLYPGQVLLEGTGLSEGRGTTVPFEVGGAPYINAELLLAAVSCYQHPGVGLQAFRFRPTFDKWSGQTCGGLAIHVVDPGAIRSVRLTVAMIDAALQLAPQEFTWLRPPYEYENEIPPIDILFGSDRLRNRLRAGNPLSSEELSDLVSFEAGKWRDRIAQHLIYGQHAAHDRSG